MELLRTLKGIWRSKVENLALAFLKKLVSHTTLYEGTIDELEVYEPDDVIWAYEEGYHQAEKDNELTWEDVMVIHKCIKDAMNHHLYKMMEGMEGQKIVYEEVLKRFKDLKK